MEKRTDWVDYAKGIGIILVVYGHVARGLFDAGINIPESFYRLSDSIIYSFHMPLFFFLSGMFFYSSFKNRGPIKLINSKIDTIVYPYLLWSILQGGIEVGLSNFTNGSSNLSEVFGLLWNPRAQFWFLYALFSCFILSTAIYMFVNEKMTKWLLILFIFIYLDPLNLMFFNNTIFIVNDIKNYFLYFLFGVQYQLINQKILLDRGLNVFILGLLFICLQYLFHITYEFSYTDKGLFLLFLSFISILFIVSLSSWLSSKSSKAISYISYLGYGSMAIYLMHILIGSGARIILINIFNIESLWIHLAIGVFSGVCIPLIVLYILKKYKILYVLSAPISHFAYISRKKND
ncbi:acyltransferase family protein [Colwellia piezophila]|uniref:acyltransferase family protein n=1 Tax=Colwellia piezophila TaxID=211668 RepID=UPI00036DE470|nr:acyltransferase [Colwellia piezophila]